MTSASVARKLALVIASNMKIWSTLQLCCMDPKQAHHGEQRGWLASKQFKFQRTMSHKNRFLARLSTTFSVTIIESGASLAYLHLDQRLPTKSPYRWTKTRRRKRRVDLSLQ